MNNEVSYVDILRQALMGDARMFGPVLLEEQLLADAPAFSSPLDGMFFAHFGKTSDREGLRALSLLAALYLSVVLCGFPQRLLRSSAMFLRENISIPTFNCTHYDKLFSYLASEDMLSFSLLRGVGDVEYVIATKKDIFDAFDFLTNGL